MKRLIRRHTTSDLAKPKIKRLIRVAEWVDVDINDPGLVQSITDLMASGGQIQILYNGEWKTISPYGWNSSKAGNVLIMCYKDTGEVRSYRLDRVEAVQMDSLNLPADSIEDEQFDQFQSDDNQTETTFDLPPELDDSDTQMSQQPESELPFDDAIDALEDDYTPEVVLDSNTTEEIENKDVEESKEPEKDIV